MRFVTWFQRFRQWFAKTFGPKKKPVAGFHGCPLTRCAACPSDGCPPHCPEYVEAKKPVPPQGGSGTAPIQARPTMTKTLHQQKEGRGERGKCGRGCDHDHGDEATVVVDGYTFMEVPNPPPPALDGATISDFMSDKFGKVAAAVHAEPAPAESYPTHWESAPAPHEPAASVPEAPAPHTPEPPPSPPPAPSYEAPSTPDTSSAPSYDPGPSTSGGDCGGGGGDF